MLAREIAALCGLELRANFLIGDALSPPESLGTFDAALMLETMLAFEDKGSLLREIRNLLRSAGRLGMNLEESLPLFPEERSQDTGEVWLIPEDEFLPLLSKTGFRVCSKEDYTYYHARVAEALRRDHSSLGTAVGWEAYDGLVSAHELWAEWLAAGCSSWR